MVLRGYIQNGVVVLDGNPALPEGAAVTVIYPAPVATTPAAEKQRVEFPLVRSGRPGTWNLTNEQIGQIMDEEDAALWCPPVSPRPTSPES